MSDKKEILDRIASMKRELNTNDFGTTGFLDKPKLGEKISDFGGKVLSPMKEYATTQSPSKSEMRAIEFGFSPLAKGSSENVSVDNQLVQKLQSSRSISINAFKDIDSYSK
mgnify:FL=1